MDAVNETSKVIARISHKYADSDLSNNAAEEITDIVLDLAFRCWSLDRLLTHPDNLDFVDTWGDTGGPYATVFDGPMTFEYWFEYRNEALFFEIGAFNNEPSSSDEYHGYWGFLVYQDSTSWPSKATIEFLFNSPADSPSGSNSSANNISGLREVTGAYGHPFVYEYTPGVPSGGSIQWFLENETPSDGTWFRAPVFFGSSTVNPVSIRARCTKGISDMYGFTDSADGTQTFDLRCVVRDSMSTIVDERTISITAHPAIINEAQIEFPAFALTGKHHMAVTLDGATIRVHIDGQVYYSQTQKVTRAAIQSHYMISQAYYDSDEDIYGLAKYRAFRMSTVARYGAANFSPPVQPGLDPNVRWLCYCNDDDPDVLTDDRGLYFAVEDDPPIRYGDW